MSWISTCFTVCADAAHQAERDFLAVPERADGAGGAVELHRELGDVFDVEVLAQPVGDRLLDVGVHQLALDVFLARCRRSGG
ncbi:MAG: hypothetical protein QM770_08580 [Tepidisphaeraceae bacterium]